MILERDYSIEGTKLTLNIRFECGKCDVPMIESGSFNRPTSICWRCPKCDNITLCKTEWDEHEGYVEKKK